MSFILDALKKAEEARHAAGASPLGGIRVPRLAPQRARLLEPVDHMDSTRRCHVADVVSCGPIGRLGLSAVPLARLVRFGALAAFAPGVERELREDHQVAALRTSFGNEPVHLLEGGGFVPRHRLEVHAADRDRARPEGRIVRTHGAIFAQQSFSSSRRAAAPP